MDYSLAASRETPFDLLWLIPLFPLIGAAINGFFGKRLQERMGKTAVVADLWTVSEIENQRSVTLRWTFKDLSATPAESVRIDNIQVSAEPRP